MVDAKTPFGAKQDAYFMDVALAQARRALLHDEVPIGAVVVNQYGHIIGRGYNRVEHTHTQTAHAEMRALTAAAKKQNDWRLIGCWLYVTLEPCVMCMGLARISRLAGVVYATTSPLFGYRLDNASDSPVYKRDVLIIVDGVGAQRSAAMLKEFFRKKRNIKGG